jgi:hypothetical protein
MASSPEAIPATRRGQSGQLTYQFWAVNSRIPNKLAESHLTRPLFGQILRRIERLTWHPT